MLNVRLEMLNYFFFLNLTKIFQLNLKFNI
jgi:hypothetical protein